MQATPSLGDRGYEAYLRARDAEDKGKKADDEDKRAVREWVGKEKTATPGYVEASKWLNGKSKD